MSKNLAMNLNGAKQNDKKRKKVKDNMLGRTRGERRRKQKYQLTD